MRHENWKLEQNANVGTVLRRFFGIPLIAALLRVGFEHEFHRLTALILTLVALAVLYLFLYWTFASRSIPAPISAEEKKREGRGFNFAVALFLAVICLVGGVMFLIIAVFPPADLPTVSRWVIRAASLFLGLLSFVLSLAFILQCRFLLTGKRNLTIQLKKPGSGK
jgi:Na+/H+ antiporter NhaD/arsenite permease-like protein